MKEITDSMNYESLIRSALPHAMIEKVPNFDDFHWGFKIAPNIGAILQFEVRMSESMHIRIRGRYSTVDFKGGKAKTIFAGCIPAKADYSEPDFDFISQLLKNYKCFMY